MDRPLSAKGYQEAAHLAEELSDGPFAGACSSPYKRAVETIVPTALRHNLPIDLWPDLREWDSGLQPTPAWEPLYRRAWSNPSTRHGSGESLNQLTQRAAGEIRRAMVLAEEQGGVLIASHGTWIARALVSVGVEMTIESWLGMPMPAIYRLRRVDGRYEVLGPGLRLWDREVP
jgi:2,3-bisphosphoglycerate-dependent phosphoglycerate mutase